MNDTLKELQAFLKPGSGWIIAAVISIVLGCIYLIPLPFLSVPCFLFAVFSFWRKVSIQKAFLSRMKQDTTGILNDFAASKAMLNGKLRLGSRYAFGKGGKSEAAYADMKQIYQRIERVYFVESSRSLLYVDKDDKKHVLCTIPTRGQADQELTVIFAYLKHINPDIILGYKK